MPKKPKFKPEITRIKLNPEQAVLSCDCYVTGWGYTSAAEMFAGSYFNACKIGRIRANHMRECTTSAPSGTLPWEILGDQPLPSDTMS